MKIEQNKLNLVIQKISELSPNGITCPVCGNKSLTISDKVFEAREFQNGNIIIGANSSLLPFVTLTCNNCGCTIPMNALKLGLVEQDIQKGKEEESNGK